MDLLDIETVDLKATLAESEPRHTEKNARIDQLEAEVASQRSLAAMYALMVDLSNNVVVVEDSVWALTPVFARRRVR